MTSFAWSLARGLRLVAPEMPLRLHLIAWENSTSLQNGIAYLLEDKGHGGHPSLDRAQFVGQLLLTLYMMPSPHTQHWHHEGDVQPR
jgi:hypothetical protein